MKPNVHIVVRERGKIVTTRDLHNIWTVYGRTWLGTLLGLDVGDVAEHVGGIKYIGFGMGSVTQNQRYMVEGTPLNSIYLISSAPTSGYTFDETSPTSPEINSLELPVTVVPTTTSDVYNSPSGEDWRVTPIYTTGYDADPWHARPNSTSPSNAVRFNYGTEHNRLEALVFGRPVAGSEYPFMPISEIGLFADDADPDDPFAPPVTYANFDTIQVSDQTDLYVTWDIVF